MWHELAGGESFFNREVEQNKSTSRSYNQDVVLEGLWYGYHYDGLDDSMGPL